MTEAAEFYDRTQFMTEADEASPRSMRLVSMSL